MSLLTWVKCPANPLGGGYSSTTLRSDIAPAYNALFEATQTLGGVLTSAGGRRLLETTNISTASQSKTSLHYCGRAHDMAIPTGMVDPDSDPFIIVADDDKWLVWCRSTLTEIELETKATEMGISAGTMTLEGVYVEGGKILTKSVTALAFSFTELALKFGFHRISARKAFRASANVMAAEWWHFQNTDGLLPQKTTFGEELLQVYSNAECQKFNFWDEVKDLRWQVGWF